MAKKSTNYFEVFTSLVEYSCQASELLQASIKDYANLDLEKKIKEMHTIEHNADMVKHKMMSQLVKEFLPPIERDDIIDLSKRLDDVTDVIEDVLLRMYMFNIKEIRQEAFEFTDIIMITCGKLLEATKEFPNFKKSTKLKPLIIEINELEERGDDLYTISQRNLFTSNCSAIEVCSWSETFTMFEKCCDIMEDAADIMESVIMKNN